MAVYINKETNEYPRYQGDVRLVHPEISEEFICPPCFIEVVETQTPDFDATKETLVEEFPEFVDGAYIQKWRIEPLDELTIFKIQTRPKDPTRLYEFNEETKKWIMIRSFNGDDDITETTSETQEELTT